MAEPETANFYDGSPHVKELTPSDFTDEPWVMKKSHGTAAVLFYASWCGHCKRFKETWESLHRINGCVRLCSFNCAKYDQYYSSRLALSEAVRGFPTIMFYSGVTPVQTYQGPRDPPDELVKTMLLFCKETR